MGVTCNIRDWRGKIYKLCETVNQVHAHKGILRRKQIQEKIIRVLNHAALTELHTQKQTKKRKEKGKRNLADESGDLPRGQSVVHACEDGYGDDDVAEDASHIVEDVYSN